MPDTTCSLSACSVGLSPCHKYASQLLLTMSRGLYNDQRRSFLERINNECQDIGGSPFKMKARYRTLTRDESYFLKTFSLACRSSLVPHDSPFPDSLFLSCSSTSVGGRESLLGSMWEEWPLHNGSVGSYQRFALS